MRMMGNPGPGYKHEIHENKIFITTNKSTDEYLLRVLFSDENKIHSKVFMLIPVSVSVSVH